MATVFTIGHGTRTTEQLIEVLETAGVGMLIDVRRHPGSRRHPHFSREAMEESLPAAGMTYEWQGEALGGRRDPLPDSPNVAWRVDTFRGYADHLASDEFRRAQRELEERAETVAQAVMCAETVWWRCHRRLIADALVAAGLDVIHLGVGKDDVHKLHEAARLDDRGVLVYDVGVTPPLEL